MGTRLQEILLATKPVVVECRATRELYDYCQPVVDVEASVARLRGVWAVDEGGPDLDAEQVEMARDFYSRLRIQDSGMVTGPH